MPHRVAAALLVRDGRVLLAHRTPLREWYADCWDLVGGHLEPGETPLAAVRRECREELGVRIEDAEPIDIPASDPDLELHAFRVTRWRGEVVNAAPDEHDAIGWFDADEAAALPLADPSLRELIRRALG